MARLMSIQPFHALEYDGRSYDCGDKIGYLRAVAAFSLANEEYGEQAAATLREALADKG
jgi:UTP--glucose-1-phosphate uridylyltransferase